MALSNGVIRFFFFIINCCCTGQNSCSLLTSNQIAVVLLSANLSIKVSFSFSFFYHFQASIYKEQKDRLRTRLPIFTKNAKSVCRQTLDMHVSLKQDISTPGVQETVDAAYSS